MPTHYQGPPEIQRALDTYIKLTRAVRSLEDRISTPEAFGDLTHSQFGVLEALYHLGSLSQGELSKKLLKSTGNMTLVLDNLEKRGLVERRRDTADRRMVTISLTPVGELTIRKIFPAVARAIAREMNALDPDEQEVMQKLSLKLGKR